jgi:hypothetical protein
LIYFSGHPCLKRTNCQGYLEARLSGSMRNSNLIHSDLFASGPSALSIFFTLEIKQRGIVRFLPTEEGKAVEYLETYSCPLFRLIFLNKSVIKMLYVERIIAIYYPFKTISRIGTSIPILSKIECNTIQIISIIVTLTKIGIFIRSWELWHLLPTHGQILTITKFVAWLSIFCIIRIYGRNGKKQTVKHCALLSVLRYVNIYNIIIIW